MNRLCNDCQDCDNLGLAHSDHYGCYLCIDCYNERAEMEDKQAMSGDDWEEFLT